MLFISIQVTPFDLELTPPMMLALGLGKCAIENSSPRATNT
jgi:hypothetical protein